MTEVYHKGLNRTISINRIIDHIEGTKKGPTVIFIGGIHGNESSGVFAIHDVFKSINEQSLPIKGNVYGIAGNLPALQDGKRYLTEDLNRLWMSERMSALDDLEIPQDHVEKNEQAEILRTIQDILNANDGPFYFMDMHSTSSESIPFLVVNDSLLNRKFTEQYPLPMILGIEEYLDGPILSYINELGYVSFGFEAGQHDDLASYQNQKAFIYLSLVFAEALNQDQFDYFHYYEQLAKNSIRAKDIYEISYRLQLDSEDVFKMNPGFVNFQRVNKGQVLAQKNGEAVKALLPGRIFMPLYQSQGSEGFFEIRGIHPFFLKLSAVLRKTKFAHILPFLPGIRWQSASHEALVLNLKIARFFTKPFLHLLGYRSRQVDQTHLIVKNRESASRTEEYSAAWNS